MATGRRFIKGKGHLIEESPKKATPVNSKPGTATVQATPTVISMEQLDTDQLSAELEKRGFVVLQEDDHKDLTERIFELEKLLDKAAEGEDLPEEPQKPSTKPEKKMTAKQIETAISKAETLEALNVIMEDVTDEKLLNLADTKAEELKGGN